MLKSLELCGFKSFADRTIFEFSRGVTCVVGPNGSGKSNVVDAIKWILGDQSAKSLRGKEMADVIFNGSASRKPSGFAEATLTFDNSTGLLPIESQEVQIGRRLYRSGDSEYLLNRSPVRLKDVRDLFMGTGAGTAAYSIIEQGRVDQLLQASPLTRRVVFEEAAGISKFKTRRVEAERRLERVSQNLERLSDIVAELESQLASTRSQASKAARYHELSVELKELWTGLTADTCRHLRGQMDELNQSISEKQRKYAELVQECDLLVQERHRIDEQAQHSEDQQRLLEQTLSQHQQLIASMESKRIHQQERLVDLDSRGWQLRQERRSEMKAMKQTSQNLRQIRQRLEESTNTCREQRQAIQTRRLSLEEQRRSLERLREDMQGINSHLAILDERRQLADNHRTHNSIQLNACREQRQKLVERREQHEQRILQAKQELLKCRGPLDATESELRQIEQRLQSLEESRAETLRRQHASEALVTQLNERRCILQGRHTLLDELNRETVERSTAREILKLAQSGHPPWNQMLGPVHELVDVPLEHAPLIEAALVGRIELLVVRNREPFDQLINAGQWPTDERVGLISLCPTSTEEQPCQPDLAGIPGVLGRADTFVFESPRAPGLARRLLGDTWIVDSLGTAIRLMESHGFPLRLVTLQGELLEPDGTLYLGQPPADQPTITRRSELNELRQRLAGIEEALQVERLRAHSLAERASLFEGSREELEASHAQWSVMLTEQQHTAHQREQQVDALSRELEDINVQLDHNLSEGAGLEQQLNSLAAELNEICRESDDLQQSLRERTSEIKERDEVIERLSSEINAQELEFAKHEERLLALRENQQRLESELLNRERHVQDSMAHIEEVLGLRRACTLELLRCRASISEELLEVERLQATIQQIQQHRHALRTERMALTQREAVLQRELRAVEQSLQIETIRHREYESQITALAERIGEEYQMTLEELLARGCSAMQRLAARRDEAHFHNKNAADSEPFEAPHALEGQAHLPDFESCRVELEEEVQKLRRKLKMMGHVNSEALENLEELEQRYSGLSIHLGDLQAAKRSLEDIIRRINSESERLFMETFESIRGHFRELFRKLFGGGEADIILEDPQDVLECGIDIVARPPGKELTSISLLSGGEKTLTAVGLLFAMFKSKPSPYCILDEVDAALDDANVDRYVSIVKEFQAMTQFVVITHRKRTMTAADVLYGVTMEQAGVSKRMSVRFEDVSEHGEIKDRSAAA